MLGPATARQFGVKDSLDPVDNLDGGTRYLRGRRRYNGDVKRALAAYNGRGRGGAPAACRRTGNARLRAQGPGAGQGGSSRPALGRPVRTPLVTPRAHPEGERGFTLVIVLAGITVMMIMMGAAVPTWRYIMQDDREQELFFRGDQIARAVEEYQRKNGNAFPPSFEVLIKGKFLRRQYKDPMVKGGKWRIVRPGEAVPVSSLPASGPGGASPRPSPTPPRSAFGPPGGTAVGASRAWARATGQLPLQRTRVRPVDLPGRPAAPPRAQHGPERARCGRRSGGEPRERATAAERGAAALTHRPGLSPVGSRATA